jgi:hypothetical protein
MKQEIVQSRPKNAQLARRVVKFALFFNAVLVLTALCEASASGAQGLGMMLVVALIVDVPIAIYALSQDLSFVWGCQHTFTRVCRGLGGNFKYEGFSLANSIREGMKAKPGQYVGNQTKTVYPTLRTVSGSREAWDGLAKPNPGQNVNDFNKHADAFALAYHVQFCNFDEAENGLIRIRAGKLPLPPAYTFDDLELTDGN